MPVTMLTAGDSVRARLGRWPHDPNIVQIVMLDHHMCPTVDDVTQWVSTAAESNPERVRTGAMFPDAAEAFLAAGFRAIDELALLEAPLTAAPTGAPPAGRGKVSLRRRPPTRPTTRRMRIAQLDEIADIDRLAFGDPWGNDEQSLRDIMDATPHHRSRIVRNDGRIDGFAISGQSGSLGYLQRLAVRPEARRGGIASALIGDATNWMRNRKATTVMVNTALDNAAALALYEQHGFERRAETLTILELVVP